jgi:2'-5' RNA ligase
VTAYRPFIDDPDHIALLEGQRYVVLRPTGMVPHVYDSVRASMKGKLAGLPVSYPAQPHVTLTGFPKGTSLQAVRELVAQWAPTTHGLRLETEKVTVFPAPFQIVIAQVRQTAELLQALSSLREAATERELGHLSTIAPADWIFHMSVVYCSMLTPSAWADVTQFVETVSAPSVECVVNEVEIVAFDSGQERSVGVFDFSTHRVSAERYLK